MLGGAASPYSKPPMKPPFRFHILSVPHTVTRKDYSACAFTQKALKFCKMMHRRGHIVYHYGHKDSEVECTEHVVITDNDLFQVEIIDHREYNPLSKIPSVLRGCLPFVVKEYDIKRAFPSFIDIELNTDFRHTIYDKIKKSDFAMFLNSNSESKVSI